MEQKKKTLEDYVAKTVKKAAEVSERTKSFLNDSEILKDTLDPEYAEKYLQHLAALSMDVLMVKGKYEYIQRQLERKAGQQVLLRYKHSNTFIKLKKSYEEKIKLLSKMYQGVQEKLEEQLESN